MTDTIKVLLVDDDEDYYVLTKDVLSDIEGGHYALEWAGTYVAGWQAIQRNHHDVCLVDYRLGAHTGLELMREAVSNGFKAPMILLTGQGDREVDLEAMKAGAADFLGKSQLNGCLLERAIRYAIERARTLESMHNSQRELLKMNEKLRGANEQLQAAQASLMQADKMETVGRLAAGVAHEVKNPLTVITMGIEYLSTDLPPNGDPSVPTVLKEMQDSALRADSIIRGLLDFSASSRWDVKDEDLNSAIEQSLQLVRHDLMKNRITVDKNLGDHLPCLKLNRTKVEQVFINLFINALHAMPGGGTLSVRTYLQPPQDGNPSGTVVAEVSDSGTGVPPEILPKIFEPFFTTKPTGIGTGLGLSVVKNIVELHGGTITLANRPEGGAQVTITFNTGRNQ